MQRKEIFTVSVAGVVAAIISFVIAGALFNSPKKHISQAPNPYKISPSFPDVKNDPQYNFFLNSGALDPTQPIQIGNSPQNSNLFNNPGQ